MVTRVVSAEDSYLIREGMRLVFDTQDDLELVASTADLPALLAAVDEHRPDVVVTDIRMPPTGRAYLPLQERGLSRELPGDLRARP